MKKSLIHTTFIAGILPAFILMISIQTSRAGSATRKANPPSGDWNTATNWMPTTVPNGVGDTATFASSNTTNVSLSDIAGVKGVVFNPGASAFTITLAPPPNSSSPQLLFDGLGITNNSGIAQNFVNAVKGNTLAVPIIVFNAGATAGSSTFFTNNGGHKAFGIIDFFGTSTAGSGTFTNNPGAVSGGQRTGGRVTFLTTRRRAMAPSPTTAA